MKPIALLGAKLFGIALVLSATALPTEQPQMTSDILQALNEAGLLKDTTYERLKTDIEQGYSRSRAVILERMADDNRQHWLAEQGYPPNALVQHIDIDIDGSSNTGDLTNVDDFANDDENLEHLRLFIEHLSAINTAENITLEGPLASFLEQLGDTEILSTDDLRQLGDLLEQLSIEQQAKFAEQKRRLPQLLDQIHTAGLLTERIYQILQPKINSEEINSESSLYRQAADWMELEESLSANIVAPRLAELNAAGILSNVRRVELLDALRQKALDHPIDFLDYLDYALVLDTSRYAVQPESYFTEGYNAVADRLAAYGLLEHPVGDFQVQFEINETSRYSRERLSEIIESDEYESAIQDSYRQKLEKFSLAYDVIVSAQSNGRTYRLRSYFGPLNEAQNNQYTINADRFAQLFDKILLDQGSPYRIYGISSSYATGGTFSHSVRKTFGEPTELDNQIAFLALTDAQAQTYFYERISGEYSPLLYDSDHIDKILDLFEQIGLLDHLESSQIEASKKLISESYINRPYELFSAFQDVVLLFEWESGNIDNPYQSLTEQFAAISRGNFAPTEISNEFDWDTQTAAQTFLLNGTKYNTSLTFAGDWLDPKFFEFIQSVAEQEISTGKFYPVDIGYDAPGYLFLTPTQLEALTSENLIQIAQQIR